jgi:hypothetical protein
MGENLTNALVIALIGMGLIVAAIGVFWFLISVLMRSAPMPAGMQEQTLATSASAALGTDLRRQAAAVAVAVALAQDRTERPRPFPLPPPVLISTWQSVNRARLLGRRGSVR